jgi:hypothetical protein
MNAVKINKAELLSYLDAAADTNCALVFRRNTWAFVVQKATEKDAQDSIHTSNTISLPNLRILGIDDMRHYVEQGSFYIKNTKGVVKYVLRGVPSDTPLIYVDGISTECVDGSVGVIESVMPAPVRSGLVCLGPAKDDNTDIAKCGALLSSLIEDLSWANYDILFKFGMSGLNAYLLLPPVEQDGWMLTCNQIHYPCTFALSDDNLVSFTFGGFTLACPEGFTKQTLRDAIVRCFNLMPDVPMTSNQTL